MKDENDVRHELLAFCYTAAFIGINSQLFFAEMLMNLILFLVRKTTR